MCVIIILYTEVLTLSAHARRVLSIDIIVYVFADIEQITDEQDDPGSYLANNFQSSIIFIMLAVSVLQSPYSSVPACKNTAWRAAHGCMLIICRRIVTKDTPDSS